MADYAPLTALAERYGINTMVGLLNEKAKNETDLEAFQAKLYYDQMMLEKLKIGQENYVYLKYAKLYTMPKGHAKWTIRRNFPLTEHTTPLLEGIPPRSDKMKKERIEGIYHQYGRYMEFTDRIEWKLLDPVVMEYAEEYGDVATRTLHRLARKELLSTTMQYFASNKSGIGELEIGDTVGFAEFRLAALKMARLLVRPVGSHFRVITSEEHYWDLMKDELVLEYIGTNNGLTHYKDGNIPELFGVSFEKTMMDDFTYGYELANTGEYLDGDDVKCRVYYVSPVDGDHPYEYMNITDANRKVYVAEEYKSTSSFNPPFTHRSQEEGLGDLSSEESATTSINRLSDGSWIPIRTVWNLDNRAALFGVTVTSGEVAIPSTKGALGSGSRIHGERGTGVADIFYNDGTEEVALGTIEMEDNKVVLADLNGVLPEIKQLPVHKAIMLGADALAQLEVTGEGNVNMFVKPKGSAGVLDPIDQRQSIGFKINTIGFKLIREEACWVFNHVPTQAPATAGISL